MSLLSSSTYGDISILFFSIKMPNCLFQSITEHLYKCGSISNLQIMNPLSTWMPLFDNSSFKLIDSKLVCKNINSLIRTKLNEILELFKDLSEILNNKEDAIPMMPLGTYIEFNYSSPEYEIAELLTKLENVKIIGVAEFKFALAEVLANFVNNLDLEK